MTAPAPLVLTLPFEALVSDNRHLGRTGRRTKAYRFALEAVGILARAQWRQPPWAGDLVLVCRFHFPDRKRRDVLNYAKLLGDALTGVCWHDDVQIADARYVRGPIDRARPRAEITLTPP